MTTEPTLDRLGLHELDSRGVAFHASQPRVTGDQRRFEDFRQGDVAAVVRAHDVSQRPDAGDEPGMAVSVEGEHVQPGNGVATRLDRDLAKANETPDRADDLEVDELRRVQHRPFTQEAVIQIRRPSPKKHVDDHRRIDDDARDDTPNVSRRHGVAE